MLFAVVATRRLLQFEQRRLTHILSRSVDLGAMRGEDPVLGHFIGRSSQLRPDAMRVLAKTMTFRITAALAIFLRAYPCRRESYAARRSGYICIVGCGFVPDCQCTQAVDEPAQFVRVIKGCGICMPIVPGDQTAPGHLRNGNAVDSAGSRPLHQPLPRWRVSKWRT